MLLHSAMCTQLQTQCAAYAAVCVCTNYIGWGGDGGARGGGGIISAGGPALPAFQRGIATAADADDKPDADAGCDERFSPNK